MTAIRRGETAASLHSGATPHASAAQLIRHVLERPELVAAVRELPGETLGRLIERVGLEDAGEIVALASTEQLAQVFDQDLWRAAHVGGDENFQSRRFGLWLEVLAEAGEDFLVQRLVALPEELLQLALHRLILVLDMDAMAERWSEPDDELEQTEKVLEAGLFEEWEEFRLIAREPDYWDVLWSALLTLDRDHHQLLRGLIERCAALDAEYIDDNGGLIQVLTSAEMLESDVAAERTDRRAGAGHVAPSDARAFLALARGPHATARRDPITHAYFRELDRSPAAALAAQESAPSRAVHELKQLLEERPRRVADARPVRALPPTPGDAALPAARKRPNQVKAGSTTGPTSTLLEGALAELRALDPVLASARLEELAYLANVWIAGGAHEGRKPRPVEALEYVIKVCNAALEHIEEPSDATAAAAPELRSASPTTRVLARTSCDLLFRRGYAVRRES